MLMHGSNEAENDPDYEGESLERLRREREEELCDTFRMFDFDNSGFISAKELGRILVGFSGLSQDQVNVVMKQADIDRDGEVTCIKYYLGDQAILLYSKSISLVDF